MKILPGTGVYAVKVALADGSEYRGMMNVGLRPTLNDDNVTSFEVYLLDFEGDLYNAYITVQLLQRIRNEEKFPDLDALKNQLKADEDFVRMLAI